MPKTTLFVHVGQRIGRGVVIETGLVVPRRRQGGGETTLRSARLLCDCGNEYVSSLQALVGKRAENQRCLSCGCLRREHQIAAATKHGMAAARAARTPRTRSVGRSPHPLYKTWDGMMQRCENPNHPSYANYGGRGITVCDEWRDVRNFAAWIEANIGLRPEGVTEAGHPLYSLDRWPDTNGNYEPGNVRWATWIEQANNRRPMPLRGPQPSQLRRYAKVCEHCGGSYQAARDFSQFCSKACKAAHRRAVRADDVERTCHQCGGTFTANRYDGTRHCGQSCAATCQHAGNCPALVA